MKRESLPLVSGANGETDEADRAEIECRWRTSAPEERIGEVRFSLWKTDAPLQAKPYRFSPAFFSVAILGSFSFIAVGAWVAGRIRQGDFLLGQIFGIGLFVAIYGSMIVAVIASRRTKRHVGEVSPPPEGFPSTGIACHAYVCRRGRCVGWLWFEGDLMIFCGAGFDFQLRREDFKGRVPLVKALRSGGGSPLKRPKGVSEYLLFLTPGVIVDGAFAPDRSLWKTLEADFAAWESGSYSTGPSLFPPIRPVPTVPATLRWTSVVILPLFMGALLGFAALVLPIEPTNGKSPPSPWNLALAGAAFGLMWPLILWTSDRTGKTYAREANRAAAREG